MLIKPVHNSMVNKGTKDKNIDEFSLRVDLAGISDESRFDENSDLSTTYLGKSNMT